MSTATQAHRCRRPNGGLINQEPVTAMTGRRGTRAHGTLLRLKRGRRNARRRQGPRRGHCNDKQEGLKGPWKRRRGREGAQTLGAGEAKTNQDAGTAMTSRRGSKPKVLC